MFAIERLLAVVILITGLAAKAWADPSGGSLPANVMRGIPADARADVALINSDGSVSGSASTARGLTTPASTGDVYRNDAGDVVSIPKWLPFSDARGFGRGGTGIAIVKDKQTGPFHAVYSMPGYSFEEADVYLPSDRVRPPEIFVHRPGSTDTVYVYLGGQSSTGGAVDAGFQHSPSRDNWALFIICEGFSFHVSSGARFAAGQTARLRFFVPADNYVAVSATGRDVDGRQVTRTVVLDVSRYPSTEPPAPLGRGGEPTHFTWTASGQGDILKRMTSIAQHRQSWTTQSFIKGIHWTNVRIGTSGEDLHRWRSADQSEDVDWPDTTHIVVDERTPDDETVDILLDR